MGVDVSILIGHKLDMQEILQLPAIVAAWADVNAAVRDFSEDEDGYFRSADSDRTTRWAWEANATAELEVTEARVHSCWEFWEGDDDAEWPELADLGLEMPFGWLKVNRHTVCITPYQHKWANLWEPEIRAYLMATARLIAEHLGQRKAVYCVDSAFPQSRLEELSFEGRTIDAIEAYGNEQFGMPPRQWDKDAVHFYFVDRWEEE